MFKIAILPPLPDAEKFLRLSQVEHWERKSKISREFVPLIRLLMCYMLTDVIIIPTLDKIMQFLHDTKLDANGDALQWTYCRTRLYCFKESNDFTFTNTPNYHECTRERESIISIRDNYLF